MKVTFFASDKPREQILAEGFIRGLRDHGDEGEIVTLKGDVPIAHGSQAACMVGVKSLELWKANMKAGVHCIMFDKGYDRDAVTTTGPKTWAYWRVAVDAHHPTHYLMKENKPHDRIFAEFKPWREYDPKGRILVAGSSAKYHRFYDITEPTRYWRANIKRMGRYTSAKVIYRPKPSWHEAVPIKAASFSKRRNITIMDDLGQASVMVTHGSNAVVESILEGVPVISLGPSVAAPISSYDLSALSPKQMPYEAPDEVRLQWLANLGYCQWTVEEMRKGLAWPHIKPYIFGV
jgi:hypothetical protein